MVRECIIRTIEEEGVLQPRKPGPPRAFHIFIAFLDKFTNFPKSMLTCNFFPFLLLVSLFLSNTEH